MRKSRACLCQGQHSTLDRQPEVWNRNQAQVSDAATDSQAKLGLVVILKPTHEAAAPTKGRKIPPTSPAPQSASLLRERG